MARRSVLGYNVMFKTCSLISNFEEKKNTHKKKRLIISEKRQFNLLSRFPGHGPLPI